MLTIIRNGKFTGVQYPEDSLALRDYHTAQGDICVDYPKLAYTVNPDTQENEYEKVPGGLVVEQEKQDKKDAAKRERETSENANIRVLGVVWQVDLVSRDRMRQAIDRATYQEAPSTETLDWILADNSERKTTINDLKAVLAAHAARTGDIVKQYQDWLKSDRADKFVYF